MNLFHWLRKYCWPLNKIWPLKVITYKGIDDLPQYYWNEIHKDYDLSLLTLKGEPTPEELIELWTTIYNEFIDEIGLDPEFIKRLERKKKIISMRYEFVVTGNKVLRTMIRIEEALLNAADKQIDFDFRKSVASMRKFMTYHIDAKKITVAQYHENAKLMSDYVG